MTNEQKKQLLLDLIKIEENGEIFNFTRAERAEFQMWVDGLVDQEPRKGHWIDSSNGWMCSECNRDNTFDTNYCPKCSAKMVEPQESEG